MKCFMDYVGHVFVISIKRLLRQIFGLPMPWQKIITVVYVNGPKTLLMPQIRPTQESTLHGL